MGKMLMGKMLVYDEWQRAYKHAVTDCKYTIAVLAA